MRPHSQRQTRRPAPGAGAESGFTILETVIALCVALIVGFGAIGLFLFSASFNAGASDRARALAIAQQTLEELRAKDYTDASLNAGTTTTTVTRGSTDEDEADQRSFTVMKKVEPDGPTNPAGRQKKITVTVTPVALEGRFSPGGVTLLMLRSSDAVGSN
jgi:Tfp pilus assembly protein PilV